MITALILFGLKLAPLYKAIAQVESERGFTSPNVYQIRNIYVQDVNQIYDLKNGIEYHSRDVYDQDKAEMMMYLYWKKYAYDYAKSTGLPVTYEVLARIHNGGPRGMYKTDTRKYWQKVSAELRKQGVK